MPTDSNGVYTLPAGYLAVTGTTIQISQHNPTFEDVRDALTARLPVNGSKGMSGPLSIADGTEGAPSLRLGSALTTGWYKITGGWGFSVAGANAFQITTDYTLLPRGATAARPGTPAAGMLRFNTDNGAPEFYNGTLWVGIAAGLSGAQMPYGAVINGTIVESHSANAVTFALKTLAGNDPSASDPVLIAFRNSTLGTGNYVYKTVTAALSLVISSGSTVGTTSNVAFKLWLVLFNDGGTVRLGAINNVSGSNVYPLGQMPIAISTAEGGLGAADSAQTFYTGTAVTSMPYVLLGYAYYGPSVISTAGAWAAAPTSIQLYGAGVPLPGQVVQTQYGSATSSGTVTNTAYTALSGGPSVSITPTSASNLVRAKWSGTVPTINAVQGFLRLVRGSTQVGVPVSFGGTIAVNDIGVSQEAIDAPGVTTSTTYSFQGKSASGTVTFPDANTGAVMTAEEIMT